MKTPTKIFLIGPMGAGKTTIGRRLAQSLKLHFVDSDKAIEDRTGASIPLIFELEGEAGFRAREKAMIDELTRQPDLVLATGGGAVLDPDNRRALSQRGFVVYLRTSVDEQLARTRHDTNRPLLQTADPRAKLESLLQQRGPLYEETAHYPISTDGQHARQVVRSILRRLQQQEG